MKLAILFWFYKELDVCQNRLEILRQYNPTISIYGLYGGEIKDSEKYKFALEKYLDNFYVFPEEKNSYWKWIQGDLMITNWYRERGKDLEWDTIVVVQWDMLIFESIEKLFSMIKQDQILLSGLRLVEEIENDWQWVSGNIPNLRHEYLRFLNHIREKYGYQENPLGCLFIVACLPRVFLEKYSQIEEPELGFLEYRIPIYAQMFGISFCKDHSFNAWWVDADPIFWVKNPIIRAINLLSVRFNPNPLNPAKREISLIPIFRHLSMRTGARIFHPYEKIFPMKNLQRIGALTKEFKQDLNWLISNLLRHKKDSLPR